MFIVASRFVDGRRGLHQPDAFGRSDLRRGNERKHINVWLIFDTFKNEVLCSQALTATDLV